MSESTSNESRVVALVAPDHSLSFPWSQSGREVCLWTRGVTHVMCVVVNEQRGAIFNYSTLPEAEDPPEEMDELRDADEPRYINPAAFRALAEQAMVQMTYAWEENENEHVDIGEDQDTDDSNDGPTLKAKFQSPEVFDKLKLFIFLPSYDTWRVKEHIEALKWLEEEIPKLIVPGEKRSNPKTKVIQYRSTVSHPFTVVEVHHDGTSILPKVSLNGVQQTPPVPGW